MQAGSESDSSESRSGEEENNNEIKPVYDDTIFAFWLFGSIMQS